MKPERIWQYATSDRNLQHVDGNLNFCFVLYIKPKLQFFFVECRITIN